jgi:hypothetical protein
MTKNCFQEATNESYPVKESMPWIFGKGAGLLTAKHCTTPMENKAKYHKEKGTLLTDLKIFEPLIWRLLYLTHSQLDICH